MSIFKNLKVFIFFLNKQKTNHKQTKTKIQAPVSDIYLGNKLPTPQTIKLKAVQYIRRRELTTDQV